MAGKASSLTNLSIRSLGVIESAELEFSPGFTVLTGETGAGKTMVLTALGLILGAKSDSDFVRHGSERLSVSARFTVPTSVAHQVEDLGAELDGDELLIARTVNSQGKSRIALGGAQITNAQVTLVGESLVEIHAQSSSVRLMKPAIQRSLLDAFGVHHPQLDNYQSLLSKYRDLEQRIKDLRSSIAKRDQELEELRAFASDFSKTNPQENEITEIENEISRLGAVESIHEGVSSALNFLSDEEASALNYLNQARKSLESVRGKDSHLDHIIDSSLDALFSVQESSGELARYLSTLEADPARFEALQQRKAEINLLIKKYGRGSDRTEAYRALLDEGIRVAERISDLTGGDDRLLEMEKELGGLFTQLRDSAQEISLLRTQASEKLSEKVSSELLSLSMPQAKLHVEVLSANSDDPKNYAEFGLDEVKFLFASHSGTTPLPLAKAASGGELSRVMLAIEIVLASNNPIGTFIFDEVDAGVGGKAALEVGRRLAQLAKKSQVIVVTHLAQVAVWADSHLVVSKDESGSYSLSSVHKVENNERTIEIARLLSGQDQSTSAQEHAAELLNLVRNS